MGYMVSFRIAWPTEQDPVSEKQSELNKPNPKHQTNKQKPNA